MWLDAASDLGIMRQFKTLDHTALLDALAHYTAKYTRMISEGASREEYNNYKETIQALIDEIGYRKMSKDNPSPGNKDLYFSED